MAEMTSELNLPGFRFHPTEEELLDFYLKNMVYGKRLRYGIIDVVNIYLHHPSKLPELAKVGEREWYFFVPRDKKHGSGGRPNRTTGTGFWKATGSDRRIFSLSDPKRILGLRKTLVFYEGRAPRGSKTDWVMNEYRLPDSYPLPKDIVLCKIYRKATSLKVLEQRAAMEEEIKTNQTSPPPPPPSSLSSPLSPMETMSFCSPEEEPLPQIPFHRVLKKEMEENNGVIKGHALQLPIGEEKLPLLQLPKINMDWNQDNFLLNSPWLLQNLTPLSNILNF